MRTPLVVLDQLMPRKDDQILFQEALGVVQILATFNSDFAGTWWAASQDNDGVLGAMIRRSVQAPETSLAIVRLWFEVANTEDGVSYVPSRTRCTHC